MLTKYGLPTLSFLGIVFALWLAMKSDQPVPAAQPVASPPQTPYSSFVAGAGIIETQSENISIGTPLAGVVTKVFAAKSDEVKQGDPLFQLDNRSLEAQLAVQEATVKVSNEKLAKLKSLPRPEDIPPADARIKAAESALADAKNQLMLRESVSDKRAISADDLSQRRFAVNKAEANLLEARAQMALLKAGTWDRDITVAKAEIEAAEAQVNLTKTEIERLTVRAPINGKVLQVNIRVGEYAQIGVLQSPLMLLGNMDPLHVRTDVDEHEAWRIKPESKAKAFLRGNKDISTTLKFVRIEPFVIPKRSLTGDSSERVDTRVLQVVYEFERKGLPVYVGQQMDVYIQADPVVEDGTHTVDVAKAE